MSIPTVPPTEPKARRPPTTSCPKPANYPRRLVPPRPGLANLPVQPLLHRPDRPGRQDQWTLDATAPSALLNTATNPENWEITETALTIRFGVYEVGPYSASTPKVEIPWPDLKPYLATPLTLPIPPR
jgi:hypothetical protein